MEIDPRSLVRFISSGVLWRFASCAAAHPHPAVFDTNELHLFGRPPNMNRSCAATNGLTVISAVRVHAGRRGWGNHRRRWRHRYASVCFVFLSLALQLPVLSHTARSPLTHSCRRPMELSCVLFLCVVQGVGRVRVSNQVEPFN